MKLFLWSLQQQLMRGTDGETVSPVQSVVRAVCAATSSCGSSLELVHLCSLCCLAGVLLALSTYSSNKHGGECTTLARMVLRCWLLRAQELVLACDTGLHSASHGSCDCPQVAQTLRNLHNCAALFCKTHAHLTSREGGPPQSWCDLWVAPVDDQAGASPTVKACAKPGVGISGTTLWKVMEYTYAVHEAVIQRDADVTLIL